MDAERGEERELVVARIDLARHGMPQGSDGEVRLKAYVNLAPAYKLQLFLFRNPTFMSIEPKAFSAESFRPPTTGHHGESPTTAFSAATTADSTIRWRRDPDDPIKLQSNARLIRWSDGSLTLQHGASPAVQHELPAKSLAPPRMKSSKPLLPVRTGRSSAYDSRLESHTYLASLHNSVGFVQITNHLTASLTVHTSKDDEDDAVIRLQEAMSAAVKTNKGGDGDGPGIISIKEDPELAKRKAEIAEKEKMRAEKRRQNQVERERDRANRVVGPRARANGLTVGGLEDEDGMLSSRAKPKPARRARRRNSEYSSDEEDGYRRKTKEDEYDQDDGFLVGSDEEPEIVEDASEEEEFGEADAEGDEDEEEEEVAQKPAKTEKAKTPADDDDAGAGGRGRRRRVVDEDED